jgi:hypothetical protein
MHDGFSRYTLIAISVIEDPLLSFSKIVFETSHSIGIFHAFSVLERNLPLRAPES